MSNFPQNFDDDTTLPVVNDNLTEIGGEAINALRDAVFNIEMNIGLCAAGTTPSIAARIGLLINPDGTPNVSTITSLGLVTLPIYNYQIAENAGIPESKLMLDYRTLDLFNYIRDLSRDVNLALGWVSVSGVKLEPHLIGAIYRHDLAQIDVAETSTQFLNNVFRTQRDNSTSYALINDMNNELLVHQWADGSPISNIQNIITNDGSTYPSNFAHLASGIYLDTSPFTVVPQTNNNLQLFAEYVDSSSLLLLGSRTQTLYSNGISRNARSSSLLQDGYGEQIIPPTQATTFLLNTGNNNFPTDDIKNGDDIVQFMPSGSDGYVFASQFANVNIGDILRVNYGTIEVDFIILEKKFIPGSNDGNSTFIVRINGKNLEYNTNAIVSVNRPLFNQNKYGVLAMSGVNTTGITDNSVNVMPSLIIGPPRGAQALGIGFDASQFDSNHYLLYLALYPTGIPSDGYLILPGIDVTGNAGSTPGQYTLSSVVEATNIAFRQPGYNYRFIAFEYQGEFGIMLADSYNNASFSILSAVLDTNGMPSSSATGIAFTQNVIGVIPDANGNLPDPLGFGPNRGNIASPPYQSTFSTLAIALQPTKLFVPLTRNNYYVDGVEKEVMTLDVGQTVDKYGDGYWLATVISTSTSIAGTVEVTYNIDLDLSTSQLKTGKTLIIQPIGSGGTFPNDFGRYIIKDVTFLTDCPTCNVTTNVTVYDAVHGIGLSPAPVLSVGTVVGLYFNSSSVSFDNESATDFSYYSPFKRYFEVFIDEFANTFTHERGRTNILGNNQTIDSPPGTILTSGLHISQFDIVNISPKLQGYQFGAVTKITLIINNFSPSTGIYDGYLCAWSGNNIDAKTNFGPLTTGKQGLVTRFYDESNIDYIDFKLATIFPNSSAFSNEILDIQLFPSLQLDEQIMILGSCQVNMQNQSVSYLKDLRQFGNTSEEQLTTSALNYIAAPTRLLNENGIISGFDCLSTPMLGFTALSGTFVVTQGSPSVTASVSQAGILNTGSLVTFSTSDDIIYSVSSVSGSGTSIILSANYAGTSATVATGSYATIFPNEMSFDGGTAVVNGNIVQVNPQTVTIPIVQEVIAPSNPNGLGIPNNIITWFVCVNQDGNFSMIASTDFNPNSSMATNYYSNGLDETRLFYVTNPNLTQLPYAIRSSYLSDLVQNQKDLVVIGIVTATVAAQTVNAISNYQLVSSIYSDARRYVYNGYGGLAAPFVLSPNGSFQSLAALNTWLTQLTTLQSTVDMTNDVGINVIVKGNNIITAPVNLSYGREVIFQGDGGIFSINNIPVGITLGNNVTFRNIRFNYGFNPIGDGIYSSTQLSNPSSAAIYCTVDPVKGNTNIRFDQCWFTSNLQYRYAFVTFNFASSTCCAQNISFTDNKFVTSYANADDQLAVLSFIGPGVNPTTGNGARLIDCEISGNYCNKNQMILIASPLVGSNILDLITCVNTTITNNVCGAINVMSKQDYPVSAYNKGIYNLDKGAGLTVSDNTCKYIFSGFADGNLTDTSGNRAIYDIQDGFNLTTGATSFINNVVHFMHVGLRMVPNYQQAVPKFIVKNNKFIAYTVSYLTPYFRNVVQTSTPANIVDKATGT
jgi:hypothetical protein